MNNNSQYYAVYNDNTLGLVFTNSLGMKCLSIIHASVLRGSHFNGLSDPLCISSVYSLRPATVEDFNDYNVVIPPDFKSLN